MAAKGANGMKITHPSGKYEIVMVDGTQLFGEIENARFDMPGWVTIAHIGSNGLIIDDAEWGAFMTLVMEIDAVKKGMTDGG